MRQIKTNIIFTTTVRMITKLARQYVNLPWVAPTQRATPVFIHVVFQIHVTN